MPQARIWQVSVYEDGSASIMARLYGGSGTAVTQASLTMITLRQYVADTNEEAWVPTYPAISTVVFDTLQTDARWTKDATGYNFRQDFDAGTFVGPDLRYRMEWTFVPASGGSWKLPIDVTAIPTSTDRPPLVMAVMPVPFAIPTTAAEVAQVWAEAADLVGSDGLVADQNAFDTWNDSYHISAIGLLPKQSLFVQISRSELGDLSAATYLSKLGTLLTNYADKIKIINLCMEGNTDDAWDILTTDPGSRRATLATAVTTIKASYPHIITTISIHLEAAITAGNIATVTTNALATGIHCLSFTEYVDGVTTTHDEVVESRYSSFLATVGASGFIVAEFGVNMDEESTLELGQLRQRNTFRRFCALMSNARRPCLCLCWTFLYRAPWFPPTNTWAGYGLRDGPLGTGSRYLSHAEFVRQGQ